MPEQQVNEIVVNTRTIKIVDDIIALSQVVRLRVVRYKDNPGFSPARRLVMNLAFAVAFIGLLLNSLSPFGSDTATGLMVTGVLVGLGVTLYCVIGPIRWILITELASGRASVLSAREPQSLYRLQADMWRIIEDPPHELTSFAVHNIYSIDLKNAMGVQIGNTNSQANS